MNLFIESAQHAPDRFSRAPGDRLAAGSPRPSSLTRVFGDDLDEPSGFGLRRRPRVRRGPFGGGAGAVDEARVPSLASPARSGYDAGAIGREAYREEIAYGRRRARRRRRLGALRALGVAVLVPVVLVAAFLASYVLTCILSGASPEEVAGLLAAMWERVRGWLQGMASGLIL